MGWFDAVATRYGVRMQGTTEVALTVVDVLGYLDEIPMCVGYEIDGKVTKDFPTTSELEKAKPVLKTLPGWKCDIRGIKNYEDLPKECRDYVELRERDRSTYNNGIEWTRKTRGYSQSKLIQQIINNNNNAVSVVIKIIRYGKFALNRLVIYN